ncbi:MULTISPECIES: hypothetical protein [unclassified Streptomyces]|uniref:hypothetical protein n=1 Tax=unclassified Streptomyces TaxID=2593676 RepID=UPI002E2C9C7A|nr:hypothetical protein [Streptomyces sp. NBC_00223]
MAAGAVGGALWWWAALRFAVRPDAAEAWEGVLAAGGWGLGLIPLHAVPLRRRRAADRPGASSVGERVGFAGVSAGAGAGAGVGESEGERTGGGTGAAGGG